MPANWKEVSDPAVIKIEPLVSVAMLAYNHAAFIAEAIEGVLMQKTDFPIEMVIGVDSSQDNTLEIVLRYQELHPQIIRVLVPEQRLWMHKNCVLTLKSCRGKYTAMCEGDDFWIHPRKLARQVEFLEANARASGSFHDCFVLQQSSGQKELRVGEKEIDSDPDVASIIRDNNIATCSMIFRNVIPASELEEWLGCTRKSDFMLALLVARRGPWHYFDDPMSVYRVHQGGIWSGAGERERYAHNIQFWEVLMNSSTYANVAETIKARRRNDLRRLGIVLAREGKLLESSRYYFRSLGSKRALHGRFVGSSKYFKAFARSITVHLGLQKFATGNRQKLTGPTQKAP